jgi:hypothetical protein
VSSAPPPSSASSLDPMDALEKLEVVETKASVVSEPPAPATEPEPPIAIEEKRGGTTVTRLDVEPKRVGTIVTRVELEPMSESIEARAELPQDSLAPVVVADPSAAPSEPPPAMAEAKRDESDEAKEKEEEPTPYVPEVAEKLAELEAAPKSDGAEPAKAEATTEPEPTQKSAAIVLDEEADDRTPAAVELGAVEEFFEAASLAPETSETFEDLEKVKQKNLPHVVARRAKFARYVGWAVGISGILCLAAVARTALSPAVVASASAKTEVVAQPVAAAEQPKAEEPKPAEQPKAEEPKPDEAKAEAPKPEEAKAEPAKAEEPKPGAGSPEPGATPTVTAAQTGDKSAREEKRASQRALERGKTGDSIAAGERSVALDPGDAEAWLILGAAYQQKGDLTNMRRAFKSCLEQATRGPKGECAQFAH